MGDLEAYYILEILSCFAESGYRISLGYLGSLDLLVSLI